MNTHLAATTSDQRVDQLRHDDTRRALAHLVDGDPDAAYARMCATVELQALLSGCGMITLPAPRVVTTP